jgi:hypothetical protein
LIARNEPQRLSVECGQSTVLAIAVMVVLVVVGAALIGLGSEGVERGRLQAVADLTALASAHGDAEGASVAARNGTSLVQVVHEDDGAVTVVVERDGRRATASATT